MTTVFEFVGGQAAMDELVAAFYRRVEADAVLRPLYPDDLTDSERHLALFLAQYFGGPSTYSEQRGHPRLRMRHAHIVIGQPERDAWFAAMAAAIEEVGVPEPARSAMLEYFSGSADWMMNVPSGREPGIPASSEGRPTGPAAQPPRGTT